MVKKPEMIQTDRLLLRGIDETDAEAIVRWRADPDVYRYFKNPHRITAEEHMSWFRNTYLQDDRRYDWMCLAKEDGRRVGVFGLFRDTDCTEVNYLLAPEEQHKGYAAEAVRALMDYEFRIRGGRRMVAEIHEDNRASSALAKKLGFQQVSADRPFVVYAIDLRAE